MTTPNDCIALSRATVEALREFFDHFQAPFTLPDMLRSLSVAAMRALDADLKAAETEWTITLPPAGHAFVMADDQHPLKWLRENCVLVTKAHYAKLTAPTVPSDPERERIATWLEREATLQDHNADGYYFAPESQAICLRDAANFRAAARFVRGGT